MAEQEKTNNDKGEPNPEFQNFQRLLKQVLSIPKKELDRRRAESRREKEQKQTR